MMSRVEDFRINKSERDVLHRHCYLRRGGAAAVGERKSTTDFLVQLGRRRFVEITGLGQGIVKEQLQQTDLRRPHYVNHFRRQVIAILLQKPMNIIFDLERGH